MIVSQLLSICPSCGSVVARESYDIGSGPEYCCAECDWCWGALGQDLQPVGWRLLDKYDSDLLRASEGVLLGDVEPEDEL